jgi:hypothetical protein
MEKDFNKKVPSQIKKWISIVKNINKEREKNNMNRLYDEEVLNLIEIKIDLHEEDKKKLYSEFLDVFKVLCINIEHYYFMEKNSPGIVESVSSLSEIGLALDFGYDTMATILSVNYSKEEREQYKETQLLYIKAYGIILNRKTAIIRYINPFDS